MFFFKYLNAIYHLLLLYSWMRLYSYSDTSFLLIFLKITFLLAIMTISIYFDVIIVLLFYECYIVSVIRLITCIGKKAFQRLFRLMPHAALKHMLFLKQNVTRHKTAFLYLAFMSFIISVWSRTSWLVVYSMEVTIGFRR